MKTKCAQAQRYFYDPTCSVAVMNSDCEFPNRSDQASEVETAGDVKNIQVCCNEISFTVNMTEQQVGNETCQRKLTNKNFKPKLIKPQRSVNTRHYSVPALCNLPQSWPHIRSVV